MGEDQTGGTAWQRQSTARDETALQRSPFVSGLLALLTGNDDWTEMTGEDDGRDRGVSIKGHSIIKGHGTVQHSKTKETHRERERERGV